MRVPLDELKRKEAQVEEKLPQALKRKTQDVTRDMPHSATLMPHSPGMELDLRGQRAEDALDMLDRYLEKAYMSGLPFVRIIHGKGTGKLRQEVRAALKGHPQVESYEEGGQKEGGEGVTVVKLAG